MRYLPGGKTNGVFFLNTRRAYRGYVIDCTHHGFTYFASTRTGY
jgi:hypothetical protein